MISKWDRSRGMDRSCHFKPVSNHDALVLCRASKHELQEQSCTHWGAKPMQSHSQPPAPHCHDNASVHTTPPRRNTSVLQTGWYAANQQTPPKPNKNSSPHTMWLPGAPTQCRTGRVWPSKHPVYYSTLMHHHHVTSHSLPHPNSIQCTAQSPTEKE